MDIWNLDYNDATVSTGIPQPLGPVEYGASGDVTGLPDLPESGGNCAWNSDSKNTQEICKSESLENVASNTLLTDDSGLITCVSESDPFNTQETCGSLAAYISAGDDTSNGFNGPETDGCILSTEDVDSVLNALLESTNSTTLELDETAYLKTTKKVIDVHRNLIQLLESINSAAMELDGKDFKHMAKLIQSSQKRGLFPPLLISEIKKSILGHYKKELNMEVFWQILSEIKTFNCNIQVNKVTVDMFYPKLTHTISFFKKKNILPDKMNLEYMEIMKEEDEIQRKIGKYKSLDLLGIRELLKTCQEIGILSDVHLANFKILGDELNELRISMQGQNVKIWDMIQIFSKVCKKYHDEWSKENSQENLDFFLRCSNDVGSFLTTVKDTGLDPKHRNCRFEHSTPFCGKCGWRTSWLIAFKKRGVYVKEDVTGINENIWYI